MDSRSTPHGFPILGRKARVDVDLEQIAGFFKQGATVLVWDILCPRELPGYECVEDLQDQTA